MAKQLATGIIKGTAMWAHLASPEMFQGESTNNYTITLVPDKEALQTFLDECEVVWNEYKETPEISKKKFKGEPSFGIAEDEEGNAQIKFKTGSTWKMKDGTVKEKHVPIFDGLGRVITKQVAGVLGNGSVIVVSYQLLPYAVSSMAYGISPRLSGVQVLKLKRFTGGGDAESLGFKKHDDAYDAMKDPENTEEDVPFTEDSEGDF